MECRNCKNNNKSMCVKFGRKCYVAIYECMEASKPQTYKEMEIKILEEKQEIKVKLGKVKKDNVQKHTKFCIVNDIEFNNLMSAFRYIENLSSGDFKVADIKKLYYKNRESIAKNKYFRIPRSERVGGQVSQFEKWNNLIKSFEIREQ